jgi:hypothetical protein
MARYSRPAPPPPLTDIMGPPRGPRDRDKGVTQNFDWLVAPEPYKQVAQVVRRLIVDQNSRLSQNMRFASLYANEDMLRPYRQTGEKARPSMPRQTLNLIKVYTDTLAGKLVQSNSRVQAVTIQGDWETFKLSRKVGRLMDSTFLHGRLFRECSKVVIDALNIGIGYLYVGEQDGKVSYERWYYNELFVDQLDAMYGDPSMLFRIRYMYPENALAQWGKDAKAREAIENAPKAIPPAFGWTPYEQGMIEVFEAWGLERPNRKGRHVLCTAAGCIIDRPYAKDKFPVIAFRASDLPIGWYGQGFIAHAGGTQIWLNRILDIMARSAHLGLAPFWVVAGGANVSIKQLNNVEGHVVTSDGPEPKWVTNKPFHESAPQYVELLKAELGIIYGISDIESSGQMPLNRLDSNPALIQAQDMWMARHTILLKNWSDEFFLDVAERTLEVAQDIAKSRGSYPVVATARGRAWAMDWADFKDLKRESYRLQLAAENALPLTPAARKKMMLEMAGEGLLSQERATQVMMGSADLEAVTAEIAAYENNADWLCEQLMEGHMPEMSDLQKPELVYARVRAAGLNAHEFGAPDHVVMAFEQFGALVNAKIQTTQAALMPPGAMNGSTSPSPGSPPPTSPGAGGLGALGAPGAV